MLNTPWVILTEVLMTAFIIWVIRYMRSHTREFTIKVLAVSLLSLDMMGGMFDALLYYSVSGGGFFGSILAFNIAMLFMSVALVYIFLTGIKTRITILSRNRALGISLVLVWNEVSMALFLRILAYYTNGLSSTLQIPDFFGLSITNFIFLAPMIAEMLFFIFTFTGNGLDRRILLAILLMQIADPALLGSSGPITPLLIVYSILMLLAIYIIFSYVYRNRSNIGQKGKNLVSWFIFIVVISAVGLAEPIFVTRPFGISWLIFAISMVLSMFFYFLVVLGWFTDGNIKSNEVSSTATL